MRDIDNYQLIFSDGQGFELSSEDINFLDLDYTPGKEAHIIYKDYSYRVKVMKADYTNKTFSFLVNDTPFSLKLKDDLDQMVSKMGLSKSRSGHLKEVVAPMPGLILDICVEQGQDIKDHEKLIVMEAMKMENILKSYGPGVIKSIFVNKGEKVEKNQILIELE